ncbi:hypothetical protein SEA_SONALI_77 [Arthrobacter phage Sonali]|uniref:Uncharacterized protein n=1 Tax=Arthrobacter phage Sonali TaxID=2510495 RepID=A0A411CQI1_9CAUD|nr:hypothetical protein HOV09_gp77 [Arthrobacter phage Sonali]QAY16189.1 hypothetical protein SEA_SONALI_77 [Arthrobacter phage Sonali]
MTTLLALLFVAWAMTVAAILGFARIWVRDFLSWPGLTHQARLTGLLIRLAVTAAALALIICAPLDLLAL